MANLKTVILSTMFILFFGSIAFAQNVTITPHYPESAFLTNRLLPFTMSSEADIDIKSVQVTLGEDNCIAFMDRYYRNIFHLYCEGVTQVVAEVEYLLNSSERFSSTTEAFNILGESDPTGTPSPSTGPPTSKTQKSGVEE